MSVGYIKTHQIVKRQTLKLKPIAPATLGTVRDRMYNCYAQVKKIKEGWFVVDVELGPIAEVLGIITDPGRWHEFEVIEYHPANFEVDDFYKPEVQKKYKRPKKRRVDPVE